MLAPEFYLPLRRLGTLYHARVDAISVAEHLIRLFNKEPSQISSELYSKQQSTDFAPIAKQINSITLNNLQVGRIGIKVGTPFSLTLLPGQSFLLQGESGVGKSTLLETLAGFLPPLSGQILINGQESVLHNNPYWRSNIGYMTQQPELLFDTIRNNLCLGRNFSDEQLYAALASAQAEQLVRDLPATLDYQISDNGGYLSGGQAQRIALARIFLHQPSLLLLDEPTANLDDQTTELFLASLEKFTLNGGMLIIASHRITDQYRFQKTILASASKEGDINAQIS